MQLPLQITFKNMDASPAVEARVRERADKLNRFHHRIMRCHVVVEAPHRSQRKGRLYRVRLDITAPPAQEIAITQKRRNDPAHEDVYVAIRDAFDAAERQLEELSRKLRGEVKTEASPFLHGRVVRLFDDYGFVATTDGQEIYFHRNSVAEQAFGALAVGSAVQLTVAEGESPQGPQATTVHPVRPTQIVP